MTSSKPIKILHLVQSLETGGLENGIINLINRSDSDRFQVDVLCLLQEGELVQRITNAKTRVIYHGSPSKSIGEAAARVAKTAKGYHIIHSHGWYTMLAGYLGRMFCEVPIMINGEHGTFYNQTLKQRLAQKFLFARMSLNLTVCAELKREIMAAFKIKKDNFKPILNGVDAERFRPSLESRTSTRQELGLAEDAYVVGSVGRLIDSKNFENLIRAIDLLRVSCPRAHCLIIGDGEHRRALEMLIGSRQLQDRVTLLGNRHNVHELMNAMDVFVLASQAEGLSNTILEAQASGLPAIVTEVGGNPEAIKEGYTGFLYPVGDDAALLKHLQYFCDYKEQRSLFAKKARERIEKEFSLQAMVENYQNTYLEIFRTQVSGNKVHS